MDADWAGRQVGAMASESQATTRGSLDLVDPRLPAEIASPPAQRTGGASLNALEAETVEEKRARARANTVPQADDRLRHG